MVVRPGQHDREAPIVLVIFMIFVAFWIGIHVGWGLISDIFLVTITLQFIAMLITPGHRKANPP